MLKELKQLCQPRLPNGKPPPDIDAYGYLEGVLQRRWPYNPELARCARDLLPYQRPKLSVQVQVGESFAEKLEEVIQRRLARPQQAPNVIEAKPEPFKRRILGKKGLNTEGKLSPQGARP